MRVFPKLRAALAIALVLSAPPARAATTIEAAKLKQDFAVMKAAYTSLHPGLYRYADRATVERRFAELERALSRDLTLAEAYVTFSRFLATIRCGHTYCNFWNQPEQVAKELFHGADKLPFTFRIAERRMVVVHDASEPARLRRGTEILAIGGVPVRRILDELVKLVKADGSNDAKRLHDLQVSGEGKYEPFDVYFPLLFPPRDGRFALSAVDPGGRRLELSVAAIAREERQRRLAARGVSLATSVDDLWTFEMLNPRTAHLRIGSFATWEMKLDWRAFLERAFRDMAERKAENLILDVRENEGGSNDVLDALLRHLAWRPVRLEARRELLRYVKVPPEVAPYVKSWDDSFADRTGTVRDAGDGFYTWAKEQEASRTIPLSNEAFRGKIYVLVGAANSSATFYLASAIKANVLGTLVGQTTGGNQRGTNGGQIFFLTLPNSGIEMDIPLVGTFYEGDRPDAGVEPDVVVPRTVRTLVRGVDAEMEAVRRLLR
jgi:hypothetical protein